MQSWKKKDRQLALRCTNFTMMYILIYLFLIKLKFADVLLCKIYINFCFISMGVHLIRLLWNRNVWVRQTRFWISSWVTGNKNELENSAEAICRRYSSLAESGFVPKKNLQLRLFRSLAFLVFTLVISSPWCFFIKAQETVDNWDSCLLD